MLLILFFQLMILLAMRLSLPPNSRSFPLLSTLYPLALYLFQFIHLSFETFPYYANTYYNGALTFPLNASNDTLFSASEIANVNYKSLQRPTSCELKRFKPVSFRSSLWSEDT